MDRYIRRYIMKKYVGIFTALCLTTALMSGCGSSNTKTETAAAENESESSSIFSEGTGTAEDPYQISDAETFLAFAECVNSGTEGGYADKYIQLTADIDLSGIDWTPIGNMNDMENYTTFFLGTFDGLEHTVSNLTYTTDDFICGAGLFGMNAGVIENLNVENSVITANEGTSLAIGGVIGYNMGVADNIHISGDSEITGNNCTGGIIGGNKGTVKNCSAEDVNIVVIGDNQFDDRIIQVDIAECGGLIIGGSFGGTIDNCTAKGTITAEGNEPVGLGGIGGCLEMMDSVTNCTADVTIKSAKGGHAIGGLCGYAGTHSDPDVCLETEGFSTTNYPSVIDNCNVTVSIDADNATHVGGIVGTGLYYYGEETAFKITNCSVKGEINGAVTPGAIAGRAEGSTIENCNADVLFNGNSLTSEIGSTTCMYESADQYE